MKREKKNRIKQWEFLYGHTTKLSLTYRAMEERKTHIAYGTKADYYFRMKAGIY